MSQPPPKEIDMNTTPKEGVVVNGTTPAQTRTSENAPSSNSVTFGEHLPASVPVSQRALDVAATVAIPPVSQQWGFLEAAYWWAVNVGKVFPLKPFGKLPEGRLVPRGPAASYGTRDTNQVRDWWVAAKAANVGLATMSSGLLVIDVDPRAGGVKNIIDWCAEIGVALDDVPRDTSPSADKGVHLYWRWPADAPQYKVGTILDGVDVPWLVPASPSVRYVATGVNAKGAEITSQTPSPYVWTAGSPLDIPVAPEALVRSIEDLGAVKGATRKKTGRKPVSKNYVSTGAFNMQRALDEGLPRGRQNNGLYALMVGCARRGVPIDEANELAMQVIEASVVDPNHPWTRHDLMNREPEDGKLGLIVRAYDFIRTDAEAEDARNRELVRSIVSTFKTRNRGSSS